MSRAVVLAACRRRALVARRRLRAVAAGDAITARATRSATSAARRAAAKPRAPAAFPTTAAPAAALRPVRAPGLAGACVDAGPATAVPAAVAAAAAAAVAAAAAAPAHHARRQRQRPARHAHVGRAAPVAGVSAGDFVLAVVLVSTASVTVATPPAGWTVHQELSDNLAADYRAVYFEHVTSSAADPASWTFTLSGTADVAAADVAYRSVDSTTPIDTAANATFEGAAFVAPSITTTHANDYPRHHVRAGAEHDARLAGAADMQIAVTQGDIGIFDVEQPTAGATGDKTASFSIGAVRIGAVDFVALVPQQ